MKQNKPGKHHLNKYGRRWLKESMHSVVDSVRGTDYPQPGLPVVCRAGAQPS